MGDFIAVIWSMNKISENGLKQLSVTHSASLKTVGLFFISFMGNRKVHYTRTLYFKPYPAHAESD